MEFLGAWSGSLNGSQVPDPRSRSETCNRPKGQCADEQAATSVFFFFLILLLGVSTHLGDQSRRLLLQAASQLAPAPNQRLVGVLDLAKAGKTKPLYKETAATRQHRLCYGTTHLQSTTVSSATYYTRKMAPVAGKKGKKVSLWGA